jgi:hypothetical protein
MDEMNEWIRQSYEEWRERALAEGRREGEEALRDLLIEQLTQRFGRLPASALARIDWAEAATLKQWAFRVIPAASLDDVLA